MSCFSLKYKNKIFLCDLCCFNSYITTVTYEFSVIIFTNINAVHTVTTVNMVNNFNNVTEVTPVTNVANTTIVTVDLKVTILFSLKTMSV